MLFNNLADGLVIEAADMTADESALTGEPIPVVKDTIYKALEKEKFLADHNLKIENAHEIPTPVNLDLYC